MIEEDSVPLLSPDYFRVGDFLIRPTLKAVRPFHGFDAPSSAEKDRRLPDKAIAVLMKLAEQPRKVMTREQLLDEVWGQEREAYDRVLDNAISELRRAFGDNAREPSYIETITKQGYRLIAPVEWPNRHLDDTLGANIVAAVAGEALEEADGEELAAVHEVLPAVSYDRPSATIGAAGGEAAARGAVPDVRERGNAARLRLFFAVLGVCLVAAAIFAAVVGDQTLRVSFAGLENGSGDPRFDELSEKTLEFLEDNRCPDAPLHFRKVYLSSNARITGGVRQKSGRLIFEARLKGRRVDRKIRLGATPGADAERLIVVFQQRLQHTLDEELCRLATEAEAACPCQRVAERLLVEGDEGAAEAPLRKALGASPPSFEVLETEMALRWRRGELDVARSAFESAAGLAVGESASRRLSLWRARFDGDGAAELKALKALRAGEPDEASWALALGEFHWRHRRSCAASRAAFDGASLLGAHAERLQAQAVTQAACDQLDGALAALEALVVELEGRADIWVRLAELQRLAGRYEEARRSLGRAAQLHENFPSMVLEQGHLHRTLGQFTLADERYSRYQQLAPWPRAIHRGGLYRAVAALQAGDLARALEHADVAEGALGGTADVVWVRGWVASLEGKTDAAEAAAERLRILGLEGGTRRYQKLYFHLHGRVASGRGQWADAVDAFYDAVDEEPLDRSFYAMELARAFLMAGEKRRAEEVLRELLGRQPSHSPALCALGGLREGLGDGDEARELYRRAFNAFNDEPEDAEMRDCKRRLRDLETAVGISSGSS